jgi:hypothetical protein
MALHIIQTAAKICDRVTETKEKGPLRLRSFLREEKA